MKRTIINKKAPRIIICIILASFIFFSISGFTENSVVKKNETVYVNLNHDGSVKDERVVNWVHGTGDESSWIDYGQYINISNMVSGDNPRVEGDRIIWPMTALEMADLFYEGTTDKDLPIDISINYYLDGMQVSGEELAGKSGNLKIKIMVENKLFYDKPIPYIGYEGTKKQGSEDYYVPLMIQMSIKADLNIFSDIVAKDAYIVVMGQMMNINFASFPFPEEEFIVEMYGEEIELEPISIMVIPQNPPFPDIDIEEDMVDLADGLSEMEKGTTEMIDGIEEMLDGVIELRAGMVELTNGISELNHGVYTLDDNSGEISNGMQEIISGVEELKNESGLLVDGLNQIELSTTDIGAGIDELAAGAAELTAGTGGMVLGLTGLQTVNEQLVILAGLVAAAYPADANIQELLALALVEQGTIAGLVPGMQDIDAGTVQLSAGASELSNGFSQYSSGISQLASGTSELPDGIGLLLDGQKQLYEGWKDYSAGISELYHEGTQKLYDETKTLPEDIDVLVDGVRELRDGIEEFTDEGITVMKDGIIEGVDDIKFGKAMED